MSVILSDNMNNFDPANFGFQYQFPFQLLNQTQFFYSLSFFIYIGIRELSTPPSEVINFENKTFLATKKPSCNCYNPWAIIKTNHAYLLSCIIMHYVLNNHLNIPILFQSISGFFFKY